MEAILRSVLLRQEQMEMQWDAEFEQQKQLFHINTSTLIDMLPIQPKKKRLKLDGRVPVSSRDKENLIGFHGFVPNGVSLKTKAPHTRGLAKRDLNTRFCDNDVKNGGRAVATKPADSQPSLRNSLDAERMQQNASIVHAVKSTVQGSIGESVNGEVDEGDVHVPPPTDESPPGGNRKRLCGEQEEDVVLQNCNEQNGVLSSDGLEFREQTNRTSLVDLPEKKTKPKMARKVGKAKECALEVEAQELSCRETHVARGGESEIVCKVEVETEVETCRGTQVMKTDILSKVVEPENVSKGPSRRGRPKGAIKVSQAAVMPEIVTKEPIRRGRAKQASAPQVAQRVTRSRARMVDTAVEPKLERSRLVETVVESVPDICEKMPSAQVVCQESADQDVELEPLCEAEVQDRSPNQIVEGQVEGYSTPDVCTPKEIILDELRSTKSSHSKGQKSVTRVAGKDSENGPVANGLVRQASPHFDSEEAASSRSRSGEQNARIGSRVAANLKNTSVDHLKDGQHEIPPHPHPQLDTIEKVLRPRDVVFSPAEHPATMGKEAGLRDGNAPSAVLVAATAEEEVGKDARYFVASGEDALVQKKYLTPRGSPFQVEVSEDKQARISEAPRPPVARLSACEEASQRLGKFPTPIPNVTSISDFSGTVLPKFEENFTPLLSEVIEGTILPSSKSGDPESLIVASSHRSSLQSGRISSVAVPLALSEAGNDASASEVYVLRTAGVTRKSTVAEIFVACRDGSGEHLVGGNANGDDSIEADGWGSGNTPTGYSKHLSDVQMFKTPMVSKRHGSENGNANGDDIIEADEEKPGLMRRELMQDGVTNTESEVPHVEEPNNSGNFKDEAFRMDMKQVKSDAGSPVRHSEARAMEEAIRCSLEQEFHPDVTLTLNRWQFRKRLSPRSKARARRWRSDVATNGVDYGRGQSSDAPAASPSRIVSSRDRSLEGVAYETSLEAQSPDAPTASPGRIVSSRDRSLKGVSYETFREAQSPDAPAASPSRIVSFRDRSLKGVAAETFLEAQSPEVGNERERVDHQRDDISEPAEEPVELSQSIANASPDSMLREEPQCSSNLISDVPSVPPSNSNLPRSNLVSSMRSFIPLVQQQQPSAPYPNGKRDVKVKALEAAEAAKRLAEQKEFERQERKKATEIAKREKQERAALEKLTKREKVAQEKLRQQETRAERENEEASKRKAIASGPTKSVMADSTNVQGANNQNVLLKVKKTHELKLKMDQEKQERLLEEQRRKEEEWKKKEAENAVRKRKHDAAEKKEREDKRRRQEDSMKAHRELEERQRLELEKKTQKQRAMEELEKERKAIEEELKRQRRLDKEREVEQRRKKEEERELAWLEEKEATRKRKEEAAKQMKLLENEGRQQAVKMRRPSNDPAMPSAGPYHSFMASLHMAMGIGEGIGAHLSGVNSVVDPQRVSSQSLVGHPLRVLQHSAEGAGAIRNSQAALRVPRTTPEPVSGVSNVILGSGKPLFRTPPEALGNAASASIAVSSGGSSTAKVLRDRINILQVQSGSKTAVSAAGGNKSCQPGQVGFAGPPGGVVGQGELSYEISPFRDSEDDDSEEEEKRSQKPIPLWARKENMLPQLVRQLELDPDDIFVGASSCSLDEVFEVKGSKKRPDFKRRGSSGDWAKDCLTWQEQIQYKVTMGYLH